jgi:2-enoate reductase
MRRIGPLKKFIKERTVEMTLDYMSNLVKAGVDMFDVDLGCYDNWWLPHPPSFMPPGCYLPLSQLVKDYFAGQGIMSNAGLPVPIVAVGKLGYPDLAERALQQGMCDMIMLARPLLADPEWPNKTFAGHIRDIRPCIGDQEACLNEFLEGGHPPVRGESPRRIRGCAPRRTHTRREGEGDSHRWRWTGRDTVRLHRCPAGAPRHPVRKAG